MAGVLETRSARWFSRRIGRLTAEVFGTGKRAGLLNGKSACQGRRWVRGENHYLSRARTFILNAPSRQAKLRLLMEFTAEILKECAEDVPANDLELIREWIRAHEGEAEAEGRTNAAEAAFLRTGDLSAITEADNEEIGYALDRTILSYACQARGVDPRSAL